MNKNIYEIISTLNSLNIKDETLGYYLNLPSSDIICSNTEQTLKSGDFYFIGFNPGGMQDKSIKLQDAINMLDRKDNVYLIPYKQNANSGKLEKLQKRFKILMELLNINPHMIFCTNLIFEASRNINEIKNIDAKKDICWKFHEKFLDIVQPKIILCNGNGAQSSYSYIRNLLDKDKKILEDKFPAGHGKWEIKSTSGSVNGKHYLVIGIPHLSYYSPNVKNLRKQEAIEFLKMRINSA